MNLEKHNLKEIKNLNQRGGRMLSIIDLIKARTVNVEMAGFLMYCMQRGMSFLTAGNPNAVGKTTVIGAMLNLLKPGIRIKTVEEVPEKEESDVLYLAHEIGSGPYYSYIWGEEARKFFSLAKERTIASCIHADTLEEMENILLNKVGVKEGNLRAVGLLVFLKFTGSERRVNKIYLSDKEEHRLVYHFNGKDDSFEKVGEFNFGEKEIKRCINFIGGLLDKKVVKLKEVRKDLIGWL